MKKFKVLRLTVGDTQTMNKFTEVYLNRKR